MARKKKLEPDQIYTAFDSFAVDIDGAPLSVKAGSRLKGSNSIVRMCPDMFVGPDADEVKSRPRREPPMQKPTTSRTHRGRLRPDPRWWLVRSPRNISSWSRATTSRGGAARTWADRCTLATS